MGLVKNNMARPALLIAAALTAILCTGCERTPRNEFADKVYVSEKHEDFVIVIRDNGTFYYQAAWYANYRGDGEWLLDGDTIILEDDIEMQGYPLLNRFKVVGDTLVFQEEGSGNFMYTKLDDGDVFKVQQDDIYAVQQDQER